MPYCVRCGGEVSLNESNCRTCGTPQNNHNRVTQNTYDPGGFGYTLLGMCIPVVGLFLYLFWSTDKPRSARAAGLGVLISIGLGVLFFIVYFIFIIGMIASTGY